MKEWWTAKSNFSDTHATIIALLDGKVGPLAVLVLLGLDHGLALLLGLLQAHPLLVGLALLLLLNLADAALLVLLLALGHALLLLGASHLALGLLLLQTLELILLLCALLAPLSDVILQLFIQLRSLLILALHELGISIPRRSAGETVNEQSGEWGRTEAANKTEAQSNLQLETGSEQRRAVAILKGAPCTNRKRDIPIVRQFLERLFSHCLK